MLLLVDLGVRLNQGVTIIVRIELYQLMTIHTVSSLVDTKSNINRNEDVC